MIRNVNKKIAEEKNTGLLLVLCLILIIVISSHNFRNIYQLFVLPDEFGYWGNAASLAGKDWRSVLNNISYYSYGYSLLLVPLFKLCSSAYVMYQAALWLNVLLLCLSFLIAYACAKEWFPENSSRVSAFLALLSVCYPTYLLYVNIGWGETLQLFLFWCLAYCFTKFQKNGTFIFAAWIALLSGYLYLVHQRNLGVLVSAVICMCLVTLCNKKRWKSFVLFLILLGILFVAGDLFKKFIQEQFYQGNELLGTNDYSMQVNKLNYLSDSLRGIKDMALSLAGKLLYLVMASAGVLVYAFIDLGESSIKNLFGLFRKKKEPGQEFNWIWLFLLLSMGSSWVIDSVFFVVPGREDHLYYGRYMEQVVGPLLVIGFMSLYRMKNKVRRAAVCASSACLLILYSIAVNNPFELDGMVSAMIVGIRNFVVSGKIELVKMTVTILLFLALSFLIFRNRRRAMRSKAAFIGIVLIFWGKNYLLMMDDLNLQQQKYYGVSQLADYVMENEAGGEIIYVNSTAKDANNNMSNILQFIAFDHEVKAINAEQLKKNLNIDAYYVSFGLTDLEEKYKAKINVLQEGSGYYLFKIKE